MSWLRIRRLVGWSVVIAVSAVYWIKLAPLLHTQRQYDSAVIIFFLVFFATVVAVGLVLRLTMPKNDSG
ncbi:MAG TPA: hypothetical protein VN640_08410 [Sphingomicrobium sp.]|jgi:hypothetical protein|nr:hypothetical protein [Sphingomicrobium sp.]